ncbi:MAG: HAMP domain-containing histidine kinase [Acidobacteria bacterium]|nr:HAMP domain-containing histidine kinase [Acidobacteriota bacterium]
MTSGKTRRQAILSWAILIALLVLCGILGFLQYRWVGEVSLAERDRMQSSLQASLNRLSRDLNSEIAVACRALIPVDAPAESEITLRYQQWLKTNRHSRLFRRIAIASPREDSTTVRNLDLHSGGFETIEWPAAWRGIQQRMEFLFNRDTERSADPPPPEGDLVFEVPLFTLARPGGAPVPFGRREVPWLIFDVNAGYLREAVLPELLQHYLGDGKNLEYSVAVVGRQDPRSVIYASDPALVQTIVSGADASARLLDLQFGDLFPRPPGMREGGRRGGPGPGPGRGGPGPGRWEIFVRHRAGSLEAVVSRARWRNLAVTGGVLLLILASVGALVRFTRRAQKLAELQMDFVAGVSHELRTPLTVIYTAAYNLRGRVVQDPAQIERYGSLIQKESGRLKELVEQVLRFARAEAGHVIQAPEPVSVEKAIEDALDANKTVIQSTRCVVEKSVEAGLPLILADPVALKQALQNLVDNALKYGTEASRWIGVSAVRSAENGRELVEIRVADRGPGIPAGEQERIFDPFFRGRRAVQDQVHGSGLGLNLVKRIVEAHGGTVTVRSEPMQGAEFVMRIPAAPPEYQDEFANPAG